MFLVVIGVRLLSWKFCHPGASLGWPTNAWVECSVALDSLCLTVAVGYPHSNAFSSHITKKVCGIFLVPIWKHRACQNSVQVEGVGAGSSRILGPVPGWHVRVSHFGHAFADPSRLSQSTIGQARVHEAFWLNCSPRTSSRDSRKG